jgi:hypothetical protein
VRDFFRQPGIARHHSNSQYLRLRRLDQQQNRLLVGARRTCGVLINDDLALLLPL